MCRPVRIDRITVRRDRIVCEVSVPDPGMRCTTPILSRRALDFYPTLPHHACINEKGRTFGAVIEDTSVPHLLEHMIIDEQVRRSSCDAASFTGTTRWIDEDAGAARIEVSFADDLCALACAKEAQRRLNDAMRRCFQ
ncbi:hypothetical protein [Gordonibacter sp. Marseille-P4307]|uniref:hypothetical protein n=1 Tax=Gordonibacter sp. Marseille-P4307 TaxID=2161815 RepID=UPI000F53B2FF|nr:hypothetical protein [Gordonibacter sp. Marseille-P4307]